MTAEPESQPGGEPAAQPALSASRDLPAAVPAAAMHNASRQRAAPGASHRPRRPAGGPGPVRRHAIIEDPGSRWPLGRIILAGMATLITLLIAAIVVGA